MRPVKRIDVTIDIALRLAAVSPVEVTLLLVGPRTPHLDRALASIAAHQSSARNLSIVTKGLCYPTMPYHQVADAAISTSVHDSFNVSIAESLAVGCPVLVSASNGVAEVFSESLRNMVVQYPERSLQSLRDNVLIAPTEMELVSASDHLLTLVWT